MYHLARSLYLHYTSKPEYSILLLGLDNAGKTTLLNQIKALFNTTSSSVDPVAGSTGTLPASTTAGETVPTVGQNVTTIDLPDMYIKIWDIGGQMTLRRLWASYYKSCHAIVFVVDSSDLGDGLDAQDENTLKTPQTSGGPKVWHARRKSSTYMIPHPDDAEDDADSGSANPPVTPITPHSLLHNDRGRLLECRATLESVLSHTDTNGVPLLVLANKQDREDALEVVRIKEGFVRPVFEGEMGRGVRDSRVLPVSALRGTGVKEAVEWLRSRVLWNREGRPGVLR